MRRVRGLKDLIFDTVEDTTNLVERTHASVARKSLERYAPIEPLTTPARAIHAIHSLTAAGVYATIRTVNRIVQKATDIGTELALGDAAPPAITAATPLRSDAAGTVPWLIDHAEGALNGFIGDRLSRRGNALDLGMTLRLDGQVVPLEREALARALPGATGKLCVFVHGLSCTEWSWSAFAERFHGDPSVNFGSLLRNDFAFTPIYVRYNSGRHVSENGRLLSELLSVLVSIYPWEISEIVLMGHSMGGLVARSAAHYGGTEGAVWTQHLRHVFCVGSPNLGAPLEKAVNLLSGVLRVFDTPGTRVPAEILNSRSAGIKDLRFGYTVDEEWQDRDPDALLEDNRRQVPFVDGVGYYFIGACLMRDPEHPMAQLLGDLLVCPPSAAGRARSPARCIPFRSGRVFGKMHHFDLANHPDVYRVIRACLDAAPELPTLPEA
jgi:pimeloyl-ACP methyl ester carboxylesterase